MRNHVMVVVLMATLLSSCTIVAPDVDDARPLPEITASQRAVVEADNEFGFDLFSRLVDESDGDNVFISPLSVSMALGMTANGAADDTYDAMLDALHKSGLAQPSINESYRDLTAHLTGVDPKVALEIANSIWYRLGLPVQPAFLTLSQDYFDAEVAELDFADPGAPDRINGWVDDKTHGLIDQVVEQISPDVVMYLINAVYFKGDWLYEFDRDDTFETEFNNANGSTSALPMMTLHRELSVLDHERFQAIDLPYGDSLFSMTVVLPKPGETVDGLIADLNADTWSGWQQAFAPEEAMLYLPRFELSYKQSLVPVLTAMGMGPAMSPGADFTNLVRGGGVWIDDVIHQSVVKVNEEGTEAAAVTTVVVVETSVPQIFTMRVDRPFLFVIGERHSGAVLFVGRVSTL